METLGTSCSVNELYYEGSKSGSQSLHWRGRKSGIFGGNRRSLLRNRGMEFFESRPYVAQDEMRSIDWKLSARKHSLYTKIFIEEKDRPIFVVVDQRSHMRFGTRVCFKSVLAARIGARLVFAAQNGGDRIGAFILRDKNIEEHPIKKNTQAKARILGSLARATNDTDSEINYDKDFWRNSILKVSNRVHQGALVFLISDFFDLNENAKPALFSLRKKADILAISLSDPLEEELPAIGPVAMIWGENTLEFDSSDKALREKYRSFQQAQKEEKQKLFLSLAIACLSFSTASDLDKVIKPLLAGRY